MATPMQSGTALQAETTVCLCWEEFQGDIQFGVNDSSEVFHPGLKSKGLHQLLGELEDRYRRWKRLEF